MSLRRMFFAGLAQLNPPDPIGSPAYFRWGYDPYTDTKGHVWQLVYYGGPRQGRFSNAVANTEEDGLYQEVAFGNSQVFSFPVANGHYRTIVHICEPYDRHPMGLAVNTETADLQDSMIPIFDPKTDYGNWVAFQKVLPTVFVLKGEIHLSIIATDINGWVISGVEFQPIELFK